MNRRQFVMSMSSLLLFSTMTTTNADVMMFTPSQDATLYEEPSGGLANGAGDWIFIGQTGNDNGINLRRALVQFDLSSIPQDALINSVTLEIEIDRVPLTTQFGNATLHRVLSSWSEGPANPFGAEGQGASAQPGDVTWLHREFDTIFWANPGGDFDPMASSTTPFSTGVEIIQFPSSSDSINNVQNWVTNPSTNFGWMILGDETSVGNARRITSRENSTSQPTLTVDFTLGALTIFNDGFED